MNKISQFFGLSFLCLLWGTTWMAIKLSLEGFPPLIGAKAIANSTASMPVKARFPKKVLFVLQLGVDLGNWEIMITKEDDQPKWPTRILEDAISKYDLGEYRINMPLMCRAVSR